MKPREKQLLERKLKDFMADIIPLELLPFLPCLRQQDREEIEAKQRNHGPLKATFVLVDRLKRKDRGFQEFVQALRECGSEHVALMLDPYNLYVSEETMEVSLKTEGGQSGGDESRMEVIRYRGGDRHALIHAVTSRSNRAAITGEDQLISTIPYRVYSQLVLLLARDRINITSRIFDLTLEEAVALKDITNHSCNSMHTSMDAMFQLMSERQVTLGDLVQVLKEMNRYDAISVLTEAGYPDNTSGENSDQEEVRGESLRVSSL